MEKKKTKEKKQKSRNFTQTEKLQIQPFLAHQTLYEISLTFSGVKQNIPPKF